MIEFYGELSEKCRARVAKKVSRNNGGLFLIATAVMGALLLIWGARNQYLHYSALLVAGLVLMTVSAYRTPLKKLRSGASPTVKVTIDGGNVTVTSSNNPKITKKESLSNVKRVLDFGEWYEIFFRFGDISNAVICQKSLICVGTVEDFETLFEGKIVRKSSSAD